MKITVIGATGFIGKHLTRRLVNNGFRVSAIVRNEYKAKDLIDLGVDIYKGDLTDPDSLNGVLADCDTLFHLANVSKWWLRDKKQYFDVNIKGTKTILEQAERSGVKKVIFTSSVSAIRQPHGVLSREDLEHCGKFESEYGRSKYLAEQEVLKFNKKSSLDIVILNPGVVIGPGDFKIFGKMVIEFLNNRLKFRAFDQSYVPLVYIDDVVDAHIKAIDNCKPGEKYILVSENIKIIDLYKMGNKISGDPIPPFEMPAFIIKIMAYFYELKAMINGGYPKLAVDAVNAMQQGACASNKKAIEELGINFMPIEIALEKTIKWYKDNGHVN